MLLIFLCLVLCLVGPHFLGKMVVLCEGWFCVFPSILLHFLSQLVGLVFIMHQLVLNARGCNRHSCLFIKFYQIIFLSVE